MRTVEAGLHRCCVPLAIVASLAAALWAPPATAQSVIDLGTLGGSSSRATGINSNGQVVGYSLTAGRDTHAFLYSGGLMTDLGILTFPLYSQANGINASGQVVGYWLAASGATHAFLYSNGAMTDLGSLPGESESQATGINDSGQVVGWSDPGNSITHAFLYSNGVMTNLGTLGGNINDASAATGINASGQVVGYSRAANGVTHAFLYSNGVMTDLTPLDGTPSEGYGINDSGQVVGSAYTAYWILRAFLYSGGFMTDLGTLGGFNSQANGINNSGQVVGWANTNGSQQCCVGDPFLYSKGIMVDLNSFLPANSGWSLVEALAINDSGQIVGVGYINGQQHAFLLSLISLSPSSAAPGGAAFTLTVTGTNFIPGATVNWNGAALATTYVSSTEVTAIVPAALIAMIGTASVTVTNIQGTPVVATFGIHPQRLPGEPERPRRTGQEEGQ